MQTIWVETVILMVDLDNFKKVNDVYGHMAEMHYLQKSLHLSKLKRNVDVVGRYGGDEIVIILPETDNRGIYSGKRICEAVRNLTAAEVLPVTTSIGGTGYPSMEIQPRNCLQQLIRLCIRQNTWVEIEY